MDNPIDDDDMVVNDSDESSDSNPNLGQSFSRPRDLYNQEENEAQNTRNVYLYTDGRRSFVSSENLLQLDAWHDDRRSHRHPGFRWRRYIIRREQIPSTQPGPRSRQSQRSPPLVRERRRSTAHQHNNFMIPRYPQMQVGRLGMVNSASRFSGRAILRSPFMPPSRLPTINNATAAPSRRLMSGQTSHSLRESIASHFGLIHPDLINVPALPQVSETDANAASGLGQPQTIIGNNICNSPAGQGANGSNGTHSQLQEQQPDDEGLPLLRPTTINDTTYFHLHRQPGTRRNYSGYSLQGSYPGSLCTFHQQTRRVDDATETDEESIRPFNSSSARRRFIHAQRRRGFLVSLAAGHDVNMSQHSRRTVEDIQLNSDGVWGVPRWKVSQFRLKCQNSEQAILCRIRVSRRTLFEDSFNAIMRLEAHQLHGLLCVSFRGEQGLDYGGLSREWFLLLSRDVFNPMFCLFEYANKNNCSLDINPGSHVNSEHLQYFKFSGRFVGMALYNGYVISSSFTVPFYKRLLKRETTICDIEAIDPAFYNSLIWLRDNNIEECGMELWFSADLDILGEVTHHELKENGENERVTEENKHEYISLMVHWRLTRGIKPQIEMFLEGFYEVVPHEWLQAFDERELDLLLCGIREVDIEDWQRNTKYKYCDSQSAQVIWFWQFLREAENETRARVLQFITGSHRVPVGGFSQLMGCGGPQRFTIEKVGEEDHLPQAHTCANQLDLPPYSTYEQLVQKLTYAMQETEGFARS